MQPDVTVSIVNTSNRPQTLECLASLEAEVGGPLGVEVVVLDNASDDGSIEAIGERFGSVRVIAQHERRGFGANHNTVIRATTSRYVYVLNDDTVTAPGTLSALVAHMDANPSVGACGPRVIYPDGREQATAWRFPSPAATLRGLPVLGRNATQSHGVEVKSVDWVMGCALLLRREALDLVGLFDEGFFIYCEETDLCRRLADAGFSTHYVPSVTTVHIGNQTSATVPARRINEAWRSRHRYWHKHHGPTGARVAALATGAQYLARAAIATALLRLPEDRRPVRVTSVQPAEFLLNARNAVRAPGEGLAELAAARNAAASSGA